MFCGIRSGFSIFGKTSLVKRFIFLLFLLCCGPAFSQPFSSRLSAAAVELTHEQVVYDPAYFSIPYPGGDVPAGKGVCTDVVIRAYRKLGIDLQKEVHEDMSRNFARYPKNWGRRTTDRNIDHRRVPNLMTFFSRKGRVLELSRDAADYRSGDIVCWNLGKGLTHIGILIERRSADGKRNLVVHNIGRGQKIDDCLFDFRVIGHYRYTGGAVVSP